MLNRVLYRLDSFDSELHLSGSCRLRRRILRHPEKSPFPDKVVGTISRSMKPTGASTFRTGRK